MMRFFPYVISSVFFIITSKVLARGIGSVGIVGGDDAAQNSYTYTVSLQHGGEHVCGGGIIGDKFILTAAHCVLNKEGEFYSIPLIAVIGAVDLLNLPSSAMSIYTETVYVPARYRIEHETRNPFYRSEGDIAVLKLKESMELHKNRHLVKLKFSWSFFDRLRVDAVVTGFGHNIVKVVTDPSTNQECERGESFGRMRYAKTKIMANSECQPSFRRTLYNSNICAKVYQRDKNRPEGACSGDSGGPLVRSGNVVIGIFISSPIVNSKDFPMGAYTRVSSFRRFIRDAMKGNPGSDVRFANWYNYDRSCGTMGWYMIEDEEFSDSDDYYDSSDSGIEF